MPDTPTPKPTGWRATAPTTVALWVALACVGSVWVLSAWWSFAEQTRAAEHLRFEHPAVLPWTLDGLACSLALTAMAAALDTRPAVAARLGVFAALGGSVWSNGLGVHLRAAELDDPRSALLVASVVPLAAFVAFEVILGQVRRLVLRWRGLPAPAPIPALRPVRLLLSPFAALGEWRRAVLAATAPLIVAGPADVATSPGAGPATPDTGGADYPPGAAGQTPALVGLGAGAGDTPDAAWPASGGPSDPPGPGRPVAPRLDGPDAGGLDGAVDSELDGAVEIPADRRLHLVDDGPDSRPDPRVESPLPDSTPAGGRGTGNSTARSTRRTGGRRGGNSTPPPVDAIMAELGVKRARAYQLRGDPDALARAREARAAEGGDSA